ncbi:hypothetical protein [Laceyella putida]|uniref:DUF4340 domain-containing protein n=1 Tax=Laceyella putida TaxID=110101 RepID=A0ABW2RK19_9BACL
MGKNQKKKSKWLSTIMVVLLIPAILTIILMAFEDQTNAWMMRIAGNEPVEMKTKRLAEKGELIYGDCGALGDPWSKVVEECPNHVYQLRSQSTAAPYELKQELRVKGEAKRTVTYLFTNQVLTAMEVSDPAFASVPFSKVKKEFNDLKHTGNDDIYEYAYPVGNNEVIFRYDPDKRFLRTIRLERSGVTAKAGKPVATSQKKYQARPGKEMPLAGGVKAAQALKQRMGTGDLLAYDCGGLGTAYEKVLKTCGKETVWEEHDQEKKMKQIRYEYKNRLISLTFHQDKLSRIEVEQKGQPWKITGADVGKAFGKPVKTEWQRSYYQLGQRVAVFSFDETMRLNNVSVADLQWHKDELHKKKTDEIEMEDLIF